MISLINLLTRINYIELDGVFDSIENSPGIEYIREKNIKTAANLAGFIIYKNIDIIIEALGSKEI